LARWLLLLSKIANEMRFPDDTERHSIVGATGSGKTHAALWQLSRRDFDTKPWIIYDFKNEELINDLEGVQHLTEQSQIPERPGIYIVHPHPANEEAVEKQMWQIWEHGNTGVYVDEGYMIGANSKAFRALLTQGRSKHIPMIVLSQRPVWMDRFVFSESQVFQVFLLQDEDDYRHVMRFVPFKRQRWFIEGKYRTPPRLPTFHSYYYDQRTDQLEHIGPVPDRDAVLDTFDKRLGRMKKVV
jgi:hypothetical protein